MRRFVALVVVLAFAVTPAFTRAVMAQKKHAPKTVWQTMVASLNDIQGITGALVVFDMKRAAGITDGLLKRETFLANLARLPEAVRKGHGKVAKATEELGAAIQSGEEQEIAMKIGAVLAACSSCHYNVRDAERRKKME